jgi:hypothetical protein
MIKLFALGFFLLILPITPKEYFGDSYQDAIAFCNLNKAEIYSSCSAYQVVPEVALSIVFPELIRYSRFHDLAETATLELLYIKYGAATCDFSIGHFQMKPSFIESLESKVQANLLLKKKYSSLTSFLQTGTEQEHRATRIERLKSTSWQLIYLACFTDLCQQRWKSEFAASKTLFVQLAAAAYNLSLDASDEKLLALAEKKDWPYGSLTEGRFSYTDVALYFYDNESKPIFSDKY